MQGEQGSSEQHLAGLAWFLYFTCSQQAPDGTRCNAVMIVGKPMGDSTRLVVRFTHPCCHKEGSTAEKCSRLMQALVRFSARNRLHSSLAAGALQAAARTTVSPLALLYGSTLVATAKKAAVRKQQQRQREVEAAAHSGRGTIGGQEVTAFDRRAARLRQFAAHRRRLDEQAAAGSQRAASGFLQLLSTFPDFLAVTFTHASLLLLHHLTCRGRSNAALLIADATGGVVSKGTA